LNTGTEIHFNPGHSVEKLHDMDPKPLWPETIRAICQNR